MVSDIDDEEGEEEDDDCHDEDEGLEDMDEGDEDERKEMKMMVRARRERRMEEKMTHGTLMDSNPPFFIISSPQSNLWSLFSFVF